MNVSFFNQGQLYVFLAIIIKMIYNNSCPLHLYIGRFNIMIMNIEKRLTRKKNNNK